MQWSDEAVEILAELLRCLPTGVRDAVEEKTGPRAEAITEEMGEEEVAMEIAVRALVQSTPEKMKSKLREGLTYHGFDMDDFETDL
jgi:SOS response regulatory protein OraA/RecX